MLSRSAGTRTKIPASEMNLRSLFTPLLAPLLTFAAAPLYAADQVLECVGTSQAHNLETGQRGESRSKHNTLLIRRHEGKMYLGLVKGPLIEASDNGKQLA